MNEWIEFMQQDYVFWTFNVKYWPTKQNLNIFNLFTIICFIIFPYKYKTECWYVHILISVCVCVGFAHIAEIRQHPY